MQQHIFLDIETIPTQCGDVKDYIAKTVTHPGNISKAETIAKWNEESRPAAVEEAINKTGLDGAFGQVVCIGVAFNDDKPEVFVGLNEYYTLDFLNDIFSKIRQPDFYTTTIVGHNVSAFDLRFLLQRYMVNGIPPHVILKRAGQAKPWESDKVYDTMIQFAGVGKAISLDKLCLALGLPGKGEITGADVWPMVQAGRLKEVANYCADDVQKTRNVFKRMTFAEPAPSLVLCGVTD